MKAVLTYHSIDESGSPISVNEAAFRRHVAWLASGVVRVVPLAAIDGVADDQHAIAITFDDGFANFATTAWPILADHALPVTLFVATDAAGGCNDWSTPGSPRVPRLPLLDWNELARLAVDGVVLGSHSRTHADLRALTDAALRDELAGSRERIATETGRTPTDFAYPYGFTNARVAAATAAVYARAWTTELRALAPAGSEPRPLLPRLDAYYFVRPGRLEAWGTPAFRRYLWLRARVRRLGGTLRALSVRS
jgi:peptidoglycan/xylan/chitin deacetylase (PgdA/CDA1 family)